MNIYSSYGDWVHIRHKEDETDTRVVPVLIVVFGWSENTSLALRVQPVIYPASHCEPHIASNYVRQTRIDNFS